MFCTDKLGTFSLAKLNEVAVAIPYPPADPALLRETAAEVEGKMRIVTFDRTPAGSLDSSAFISSSTTPTEEERTFSEEVRIEGGMRANLTLREFISLSK